jgi:hypothetical protein
VRLHVCRCEKQINSKESVAVESRGGFVFVGGKHVRFIDWPAHGLPCRNVNCLQFVIFIAILFSNSLPYFCYKISPKDSAEIPTVPRSTTISSGNRRVLDRICHQTWRCITPAICSRWTSVVSVLSVGRHSLDTVCHGYVHCCPLYLHKVAPRDVKKNRYKNVRNCVSWLFDTNGRKEIKIVELPWQQLSKEIIYYKFGRINLTKGNVATLPIPTN